MALMTVQNMRDYVRNSLGTDSTEIPDSLVDLWRDEATTAIQTMFEPWHFYEMQFPLTTSAAATKFSSFPSGIYTIDTLTLVQGDHYALSYLPHDTAVKKYAWGTWVSRPFEFSLEADTLFLWPNPDTSYTYTVWGYRLPIPAVLPTDTVDLPAQFHPLISEYMLARGYEFEDDNIMSQQKFARFDRNLLGLRKRYKRAPESGITAIGQNHDGPLALPARLRYDWESHSP